ncbi:MAG: glycosyltransferase, partial [Candidatus Woesearchaeota archaeon]|nr:glycosyltransferase [Candidatus Woesearchaeota archaeon]
MDRMVELQAEEYFRKGFKVKIFCLDATLKPKHAELEAFGIPKKKILQPIYKLLFPLNIIRNIKIIRELKDYGTAISHYYPMNFPCFIAKKIYGKKMKYIYYNYGINYPELFPSIQERVFLRIFRFLTNRTIRNVDEAVSISYFLRDVLKRETGIPSRIEHCKIDTKRFHLGIDGSSIRKKYGIRNEPVLLFVGRISPHKGVHLLIEAFNLI